MTKPTEALVKGNPTRVSKWAHALDSAFERQADGMTYLEAYEDPNGIWTIGDGIIYWPNGDPVNKGDRLSPKQATKLNNTKMREFERAVTRHVRVSLEQHQFDALVIFAKNVGEGAFRSSDVLENVNKERFDDAARHFGDWIYGTVESRKQADGSIAWKPGPDGEPLEVGAEWKRAYRGLLRRHYSTACLFLALDWSVACHEDRIELKVESQWHEGWVNPEGKAVGRWKDRVEKQTQWDDVLRIARKYPIDFKSLPRDAAIPKAPSKNSIAIVDLPSKIKLENGAKPLAETERFVGEMLVTMGVVLRAFSGNLAKMGGLAGTLLTALAALIGNPTSLALVVGTIVAIYAGFQWMVGRLLEKRGIVIRARGQESATQVMV